MGAGTGGLRNGQGYCSNMWGWDQENQGKAKQDLSRDMKNNRVGFYKYIGQIRKDKQSVLPLRSKKGELMAMAKAELL